MDIRQSASYTRPSRMHRGATLAPSHPPPTATQHWRGARLRVALSCQRARGWGDLCGARLRQPSPHHLDRTAGLPWLSLHTHSTAQARGAGDEPARPRADGTRPWRPEPPAAHRPHSVQWQGPPVGHASGACTCPSSTSRAAMSCIAVFAGENLKPSSRSILV